MTELEASAGAEADVSAASSTAQVSDAKPAESSTAEPKGVKTGLLDRVASALGQGTEKSPDSEGRLAKADPPDPDGDKSEDEFPDEINALSAKAQKRFRDLVGQRKQAEERVAAVEAELKPKAERLDTILSYMEQHAIEPREFDNALEITRLIKSGSYAKALEVLTPVYRELANRAGKILPADLQERVRLGYITEQDARALHEATVREKNLTAQTAAERERETRRAAEANATATVTGAVKAADDWAKAKASADPDWHLKQGLVAELVELDTTRRMQRGDQDWYPATSEEVVKRAEAALTEIEKRWKMTAPRPQAKTVASGSPASPRSKAAPKTFLEAITQAVKGA